MPNWKKAEDCVETRKLCESVSSNADGETDVFSEKYILCYMQRRPVFGIMEWLHLSRAIF